MAPNDKKCACVNNEIFKHDSEWMNAGIGKKTNNPCNMRIPRSWTPSVPMGAYDTNGNGWFASFDTKEDGIHACIELYSRFYKDRTSVNLVNVWTSGDANGSYYSSVRNCYVK